MRAPRASRSPSSQSPNVQITADNPNTPDGINVEKRAYVVIDGFIVNNRTRAGIRVAVSPFVTVRNCHTGYNGRWGIFSGFADDFTIEDNEAHHSQTEHGIYVSNSGDRPVIRGNLVHDNHANGIHMNGDVSQGGDGIITDALVERNVIYGNGVGGGSGHQHGRRAPTASSATTCSTTTTPAASASTASTRRPGRPATSSSTTRSSSPPMGAGQTRPWPSEW